MHAIRLVEYGLSSAMYTANFIQCKITFLLPQTSELDTLKENLKDIDCNFVVLRKGSSFFPYAGAVLRILKTQSVDIVHSHGFTSMVYSVLPASFYKKPHLFTSHDVFTDKQFQGVKGFCKRIILGIGFHFVDTIHSVSYGAQDTFASTFSAL